MEKNVIFLLNIDNENRIIVERKKEGEKLHNDSCVFFEHKKKKFLLTDASFVDEFGYSMYHRIFNIKKFQSISHFIKLYEKELNEQKKGTFVRNFDDSYLFVCTHIQQKKLDGDNYFLTLNLLNIDDNYNLLFVEGDFDKCTVTVLKRYILSENQFEEWKKIICSSFECEVLKDFSNNKYFDDEKNLHNEFIKFLESIRCQ